MNKLTSMMLVGACALLLGTVGCGGTCSTFCEAFAQECGAEIVGESTSCEWDDPEALEEECNESCDEAMAQLSDSEAEEMDLCVECMDESLQGECSSWEDWADAISDDCDRECDDDGVGEFFYDNDGFFDNMNLKSSDLDC